MNFGKTDIMLLLTMSLAVISMSFVFPAIGLTDDDAVGENEIPEFNISTDRFQFATEFPDAPSTPTEGVLWFDATRSSSLSDNRVWLQGDTDNGVELFVSEESNGTGEININIWESGSVTDTDNATFDENTNLSTVIAGDWGVRFEPSETESDFDERYYEGDYQVTNRPQDGEGVIGSVVGLVSDTASVLAWFGVIFYWVSISIIEVSFNAAVALFDVTVYLLGLANFLISTYTSIISGASGFASVFVALPGIILAAILAKIVMIGVSLLPTT